MIDEKFKSAYEFLTPADQTLICALLFTLAEKEKKNVELGRELMKHIRESKD